MPGPFSLPFLLWNSGSDSEGIPTHTSRSRSCAPELPQQGKKSHLPPSASVGVHSVSFNIGGVKQSVPSALAKSVQASTAPVSQGLWALSLPVLLLAPPGFPTALWTSWHCKASPFPRSGDTAEQSPTLLGLPRAQKCSWWSLLNQIPPENRLHAA